MKIILLSFFVFALSILNSYCDESQTDGEIISDMVNGFVSEVLEALEIDKSLDKAKASVIFENGLTPTEAMKKKIESLITAHDLIVTDNPDSSIGIYIKVTDASVTVVNKKDKCIRDVRVRMHIRVKDINGRICFAESHDIAKKDSLSAGLIKYNGDSGFYFKDVNVVVPQADHKKIKITSFAVIISTLFWFALSV